MAARRPRKRAGVSFDDVRTLALALPGVEEGTSYGTAAFRAGKKLFLRLKEDGESLVVKTTFDARDALMSADPDVFYITDHYQGHEWVLVRLAEVDAGDLGELIGESWRQVAPARLVAKRASEGSSRG